MCQGGGEHGARVPKWTGAMDADQSWVSESALRRSLRSTSFRVSSSRRARTSARASVRLALWLPISLGSLSRRCDVRSTSFRVSSSRRARTSATFARPLQLLFQASCQDHEVPLNRLALWLPISLGSLSRRCVGACARRPFGCLHRGRGLLSGVFIEESIRGWLRRGLASELALDVLSGVFIKEGEDSARASRPSVRIFSS